MDKLSVKYLRLTVASIFFLVAILSQWATLTLDWTIYTIKINLKWHYIKKNLLVCKYVLQKRRTRKATVASSLKQTGSTIDFISHWELILQDTSSLLFHDCETSLSTCTRTKRSIHQQASLTSGTNHHIVRITSILWRYDTMLKYKVMYPRFYLITLEHKFVCVSRKNP